MPGIFDPKTRDHSGQNPQSGGSNVSLTRQVINSIFGRIGLFYNAGLGDVISPVVDTTLYYPLQFTYGRQLDNTNIGTSTFKWKPPKNKHWMVSYLTAGVALAPTSAGRIITTIANATGGINIADQQWDGSPNEAHQIPIIGGITTVLNSVVVAAPVWITQTGLKSLYVSEFETITISIANVPHFQTSTFIRYLELPSNQPFGSSLTI